MFNVMIVDDEDTIVRGLVKILPWEKYNCRVVATASDGVEALEYIRKQKPDILFTDIKMPGMDGLTLIAALRSEFSNMEITILSGFSDFEYAQQAIRLGVTRYVLKPSKLAQLEEALAEMSHRITVRQDKQKQPERTVPEQALEQDYSQHEILEGPSQNFIINNAMHYIEQHYAEKISLCDVAESVYVSQWHLSKLIGKTNQSFSDILNKVRISHAKELLKNPQLKIWEISEAVGFQDVTHFSRIFKKYEDMSANEYRNQMRS